MSTVTEITTDSAFHSHLTSLPPTTTLAISFHTPWAAPCEQMRTILSTLASSYPPQTPPTVSFLSLNAENLPDISEAFDVTAVPFLVLQRDGKVLETVSGSDASKVRDAVERHAGKGGNTGKLGLPPALDATPRDSNNAADANGGGGAGVSKDLSGYTPGAHDPKTAPEMSSQAGQTEELNKRLEGLVKAAPVMLFMKGTPSTPQCGFSRQLVGLLREKGVRYGFFNILADEEVRQGLKVWADWPTFPQLWVGGELVGGLDIVKEELESDQDFFKDYSVGKGKGGMAAPEAQSTPATAST
ncbi:MAG: monothiol glutaredoxin -4 [Lasallia pustulata]|uniref:Monothiol glutaredoxin-4 n=1 Tax=Lasallia pustulata TaxID=136370 RepID=A0A5M8PMA7_9LECA|nr:MAG: monothiol glutaredoxin -4 [Lasallia pustulata]